MTSETSMGGADVHFQETLWTVVLRARSVPDSARALDQLIRTYWKPVYFFIRRRGHSVEEAKDFTQSFFTVFLEKEFVQSFSKERGKFRTFLLATLSHFLSKEYRSQAALKRGGAHRVFSMDFDVAEAQISKTGEPTPEDAFDREWAMTLLQEGIARLSKECVDNGRGDEFRILRRGLAQGADHYEDIAEKLNCTTRDVSRRMYVLRTRLKAIVRTQIGESVASEADLGEEIAQFRRIFRTSNDEPVT